VEGPNQRPTGRETTAHEIYAQRTKQTTEDKRETLSLLLLLGNLPVRCNGAEKIKF
jgi:hypothetical protein